MSLPQLSIRRPVTTVMVYLGVTLLGVIAWTRLPRELFPPITYPQLTVVTRYRDAAPEEIELLVTKPIEEVTGTVSGLKRISSISREELSLVIAEFSWGTNMDFASLGVREKIDLIKERLPRGAEEPVVIKYNPFELPVLVLNLSGTLSPHELLTIAKKQLKNELEKVEGVAAVNLAGGIEREILVEVDQGRLKASGTAIRQVVEALSKANLNYPAGTIKEAFYEYLIRTIGEFKVVPEIPGIAVDIPKEEERDPVQKLLEARQKGPLKKEKGLGPEQRLILLKDVARVRDTFREQESISRFNGQDNVSLSIQKQAGANTLQLVDRVKQVIAEITPGLSPGIHLSVAYDQSLAIRSAIAGVRDAALLGGVLAFIVLYLFLGNPWAALNVAFAIPISVLATVALMYFTGATINIISLGGLALGTGMLVDAGIVVVENITRHREVGEAPRQAAARGTEEVATAIFASVLTTIVVFLPMVFVVGISGQILRDLAYTVTFSLLASLAVSLTLTALFASRIRRGVGRFLLEWFLQAFQGGALRLVRWFLRNSALGIGIVILLFVGASSAFRLLDRELLPRVDQGQFILQMNLPPGTRLAVTDRIARRIEQVLQQTPEVRDVTVTIGSSKEQERAEKLLETLGSHQAQILVNLWPRHRGGVGLREGGFRLISTADVVQKIKGVLQEMPLEGAEINYLLQESVFKSAFLAGTPVVVEVKGPDLNRLEALSKRVQEELEAIPGLYGVKTSRIPSSPETKVHILKDRAATYHLSVSDIALTAQTALEGFVATKFKEQGKEVDIRVRLRPEDRRDMNKVRRLIVHSPLGMEIPLAEVAYFALGTGPTEIRRLDQQRTILVSAQVFQRALGEVLEEVNLALEKLRLPAGYSVALTGESEQMQESFRSLAFALVLSLVLVYMVMASAFESLWQPFLIMGTIPMALIGVVLALGGTQTPVSVMSALGFIVLGGIVVNNGIVLIDYVNLLRAQGVELEEAVLRASQDRIRPILMTGATTVLGLLPLALGLQEGVELQVPMAITVIGGLTASTFLTLIFLPTLYVVGARFFSRFQLAGGVAFKAATLEPAPALAGAGLVGTLAEEFKAPSPPSLGEGGPPPPEEPPRPEGPPPQEPEPPTPPAGAAGGPPPPPLPAPELPEIPEGFGSEDVVPEQGGPAFLFSTETFKPLELPEPADSEATAEGGRRKEEGGSSQETLPPPPSHRPPLSALNPRQEKLLEYLKVHGRMTRKEYIAMVQISVPTAARDLKELTDRGLIRGVGPIARGRYYVLVEPTS